MTLSQNQSAQSAVTPQSPSLVCQYPAAPADAVIRWFSQRLQFETDCSDVQSALSSGADDFVLLDVRGEAAYAKSHVPGALKLPHRQISAATLQALPQQRVLVVYCAGPHCNGADQAALKIARLGYPVKMMIGGLQGYQDEGFAVTEPTETADKSLQCGC